MTASGGKIDVAVVGATGAVGAEMLRTLERREFPAGRVFPLASARSLGKTVQFRGEDLSVEDLAEFDFGATRLALFSAGGAVSAEHAPRAAAAGCVVIDNSSCFRQDDDVPLVVPEVNPGAIAGHVARRIIANPNCSTIQMVAVLKPLHDAATILRVNVATYQAVSGAGNRAIEALAKQSVALLSGVPPDPDEEGDVFPVRMAFNVIPHVDVFQENGYTREEMKMVWETRKIMGDNSILVNPTAARVPVFFGHSEALHVETAEPLGADYARELLAAAPGVCVMDAPAPGGYPTAALQAAGADEIFVGRIREDLASPTGLNMWVVSDNVRKGAALNAVQIAELWAARYL